MGALDKGVLLRRRSMFRNGRGFRVGSTRAPRYVCARPKEEFGEPETTGLGQSPNGPLAGARAAVVLARGGSIYPSRDDL